MELKGSGETPGPDDRGGGQDELRRSELRPPFDPLSTEDGEISEELRDLPSDPKEMEALFLKYPERRLAWSELEAGEDPEEVGAQWLPSPEPLRTGAEAQSLDLATQELRVAHEKKIDLSGAREVSGRFPKTAGADEILVRRKDDGRVTAYAVYDSTGLPIKRVDVDPNSTPHGGVEAPHVLEIVRNVNPKTGVEYIDWKDEPRPARPDELPQ